ncbi:hypothetical protein C5167_016261 [Papaver somniferum]|nr:hypothetical protein C5167_016261 [Papaver somniferum]
MNHCTSKAKEKIHAVCWNITIPSSSSSSPTMTRRYQQTFISWRFLLLFVISLLLTTFPVSHQMTNDVDESTFGGHRLKIKLIRDNLSAFDEVCCI